MAKGEGDRPSRPSAAPSLTHQLTGCFCSAKNLHSSTTRNSRLQGYGFTIPLPPPTSRQRANLTQVRVTGAHSMSQKWAASEEFALLWAEQLQKTPWCWKHRTVQPKAWPRCFHLRNQNLLLGWEGHLSGGDRARLLG